MRCGHVHNGNEVRRGCKVANKCLHNVHKYGSDSMRACCFARWLSRWAGDGREPPVRQAMGSPSNSSLTRDSHSVPCRRFSMRACRTRLCCFARLQSVSEPGFSAPIQSDLKLKDRNRFALLLRLRIGVGAKAHALERGGVLPCS